MVSLSRTHWGKGRKENFFLQELISCSYVCCRHLRCQSPELIPQHHQGELSMCCTSRFIWCSLTRSPPALVTTRLVQFFALITDTVVLKVVTNAVVWMLQALQQLLNSHNFPSLSNRGDHFVVWNSISLLPAWIPTHFKSQIGSFKIQLHQSLLNSCALQNSES